MKERKIALLILPVIAYVLYSSLMWFVKVDDVNIESKQPISVERQNQPDPTIEFPIQVKPIKNNNKIELLPLTIENGCSILEIFTTKSNYIVNAKKYKMKEIDNNTVTVVGITIFLVILVINAILDTVKAKEEEKTKKMLNQEGERRQSLSEFAKSRTLRRESSKFGLQLFQIAESVVNSESKSSIKRPSRPYYRGDSMNSYLSERKSRDNSSDGTVSESNNVNPGETKLGKTQSVAQLFGSRPSPMMRRSSFPALPVNPEIQALMMNSRQQSLDSDDETDRDKGKRVRIIRRY